MWVSKWSCLVVSNSLRPHGLEPTRLLHPWNFPGKSIGVGCHLLLQGIFLTQGLKSGLPHCRQTLTIWATSEAPHLAPGTPRTKCKLEPSANHNFLYPASTSGEPMEFSKLCLNYMMSPTGLYSERWAAATQSNISQSDCCKILNWDTEMPVHLCWSLEDGI